MHCPVIPYVRVHSFRELLLNVANEGLQILKQLQILKHLGCFCDIPQTDV